METSAEQVSASRFSMRRSSLKFSRSQRPLGMLPSTSQRIVLLSILVCFGSNVEYVSGFAFSFGRHPGPGDWAQLSTAALDGPLPVLSRASAFATSCVPIPRNMSLCQGLEYSKMRLPNLLEHDTIDEALEQSASWVHLYKLRCHADTQKFLCSLFAPVCLETPIFPCRSLCEAVRGACESAMLKYGYPWPDMVSCDKFPEDDMCVTAGDRDDGGSAACRACAQPENSESLLDNFCRADFVIRARSRRVKGSSVLKTKTSRIFKLTESIITKKDLKSPEFRNANMSDCCSNLDRKVSKRNPHLLIMGTRDGDGNLVPTFLMEWKRGSPSFKKSIKMMQKINCAHSAIVEHNPLDPVTARKSLSKTSSKDRQFVRKNSEEDDGSAEARRRESPPSSPRIQFDLSENFRREMELHNIAAEQERAYEEQMKQREKERKRKENRRRKGDRRAKAGMTARADEAGSEKEQQSVQKAPKGRGRDHKRKTTTVTTAALDTEKTDEQTNAPSPSAFTDTPHPKEGHKPSHDTRENRHVHKDSLGELEMVIDSVEPHGPLRIEKKIRHEETKTYHHNGRVHMHKLEAVENKPHHSEHHGTEGYRHVQDHYDPVEESHDYESAKNKHSEAVTAVAAATVHHHNPRSEHAVGLTSESATIHMPSEKSMIELAGEDPSNRPLHRPHHSEDNKPSVKVAEEGEIVTTQMLDEEPRRTSPHPADHEVRHRDEHAHPHRHGGHEQDSARSESLPTAVNAESEYAGTVAPVKEAFLTVLPIIPDEIKEKIDDVTNDDSTDTSHINETDELAPAALDQPATASHSAILSSTTAPAMTTASSTTEGLSDPAGVKTKEGTKRGRKRKNGRRRHHRKRKDEEEAGTQDEFE
ncbi:uncharacterized protein LOC111264372 isoform X2 [Varroa jacobsoni]|nr:uncharacterized protein LOC111264372 isoform X2 [Varroa jacobsoni]